MNIAFFILAVVCIAFLLEHKFIKYRIVKVTRNNCIKYRLQESYLYIFWKNVEIAISPYTEILCEYNTFEEAEQTLKKLKARHTKETIEVIA